MTIRDATVADVPAILPMVGRIAAFMQAADADKYTVRDDVQAMYGSWLKRLIETGRSVVLVADAAGRDDPPRLVGMIIGTIDKEIPIYRLAEFGFINDLWVDDTYRNEGVGRQLVAEAIERFTKLGVSQIRLDVLTSNAPARTLFATCGFRESVIEMILPLSPVAADIERGD